MLSALIWAPVDRAAVERHTTDQLVRDGLSSMVGERKNIQAVRLDLKGEQVLKDRLRAAVLAPTQRNDDGIWRPAFAASENEDRPRLTLQASSLQGELLVRGSMGEKRF